MSFPPSAPLPSKRPLSFEHFFSPLTLAGSSLSLREPAQTAVPSFPSPPCCSSECPSAGPTFFSRWFSFTSFYVPLPYHMVLVMGMTSSGPLPIFPHLRCRDVLISSASLPFPNACALQSPRRSTGATIVTLDFFPLNYRCSRSTVSRPSSSRAKARRFFTPTSRHVPANSCLPLYDVPSFSNSLPFRKPPSDFSVSPFPIWRSN